MPVRPPMCSGRCDIAVKLDVTLSAGNASALCVSASSRSSRYTHSLYVRHTYATLRYVCLFTIHPFDPKREDEAQMFDVRLKVFHVYVTHM